MPTDDLLSQAESFFVAGRLDEAETLCGRVAATAPGNHRALHLMGLIRQRTGDFEGASAFFGRAIAVAGRIATYHNNLAVCLQRLGRLDAAETALRRAIEYDPDGTEAPANLVAVLAARGRHADAEAVALGILDRRPDDAAAVNNLATALVSQGRCDQAETLLTRACENPDAPVESRVNLANLLRESGRTGEAAAMLDAAARRFPERWEPLAALGLLLHDGGRPIQAAVALARAVALGCYDPEAVVYLADSLLRADRAEDAERVLLGALKVTPGDAELWHTLGETRREMGNWAGAMESWRQAIAETPNWADPHFSLASALAALGEADAAVPHFRKAVELVPESAQVHSNLLMALQYASRPSRQELARENRTWGERYGKPLAAKPVPRRGARLRVGLVSSHFRFHATAFFVLPLLEQPRDWDAVLFCNMAPGSGDETTDAFRTAADGWHDVYGLDDAAFATRVREAGIDILIDLNGHTRGNRLTGFAHQPAPVQASWIECVDSTGSPSVDALIADPVQLPPADEEFYVERIFRMPRDHICYRPPADAPPVASPPTTASGHVTFGCFNTVRKVSEAAVRSWAEILRRVPGSRMLFNSFEFNWLAARERVTGLFAAAAVPEDRLEFLGGGPHRDFLAAYGKIDIALDPMPYSGGLNTCEALWMGVPIVTLRGGRFCGRHAACHLSTVGLTEWIGKNRADYAEIAVGLASDPDRLTDLRAGLRDRVAASPLVDVRRFAGDFAAVLERLWEETTNGAVGSDA